ncbi:MAG: alpha amylase C-terminal domain-containing protein [Sedimentisphaerales bacterium]|nr:alpha amylase C-terminal domain-containing protein [Sedimentisphaerales bacterium]
MLSQKGAVPHDGGTSFGLWAPNATAVFVTGTFNDWSPTAHPLDKQSEGWWSADVAGVKPGDEYRFRIVAGETELSRIDPYARRLTSSVGNAVVPRPIAAAGMPSFTPPALNEMILYELHIGTFGRATEPGPSDLEDAVEKLAYLKELGINAVEVMPLGEFPGGFSWGYNPSHIFSVESDYGTPRSFRDFVNRAHELGIAVIVDVVYNHLGPGDLDLWQFDGWSQNDKGGIYFYNDQRCHTPWGDTRPDYGRPEVRQYLADNALMWIGDYGVDGLRWDATAFIRNVDGRNDNPDGDLPDGWSLMQWINQQVRETRPGACLIAEDLQDNPFLVKSVGDGGAGFHAQWDARFVHAVREAVITPDDGARNMDAVVDAVVHRFDNDAFQRVIYTESHDEVANGKARVPEEIAPGNAATWEARKRSTLGAALAFTAPGVPMIFQGQEFLEDDWFHDRDPIDWSKKKRFAGILRLYQDLIRLRLNRDGHTRGLCGQNLQVHHVNHDDKVIAYHRWDQGGPGDSVIVVAHFSAREHTSYQIGVPAAGTWNVRFNSDRKTYDPDFGDVGAPTITAQNQPRDGLPAQATVSLAPYTTLILSQNPD